MNSTEHLIELYEMISMNDAALRDTEKTAILKARLALSMFHRAMESFRRASAGTPTAAPSWFRMAA